MTARPFYNKQSGPGMSKANYDNANPLRDHPDLFTDPVFLIGNGKSRQDFDLERLRGHGTIIGCNALYRDFTPDLLVTIDAKLIDEIRKSNYHEDPKNRIIIPHNRATTVPGAMIFRTEQFNTSGCFAMKLINLMMGATKCYMLGMDGYPGNVYDSTLNYSVNTLQNFTGVHNYYLKALREEGPTTFYNVNEKDAWPEEARQTGKYEHITYDVFEQLLAAGFK